MTGRPAFHRLYINSSPQEPGCLVRSGARSEPEEVMQRRGKGITVEFVGCGGVDVETGEDRIEIM